MVDMHKQIDHWRKGSGEDWDAAQVLLAKGKIRHSLFFAHLALEKLLKAHICRATDELAPPIHNLSRLAAIAAVQLSEKQASLLADVNEFNIEGRYPEMQLPSPSPDEAKRYSDEIEELLRWLNSRF